MVILYVIACTDWFVLWQVLHLQWGHESTRSLSSSKRRERKVPQKRLLSLHGTLSTGTAYRWKVRLDVSGLDDPEQRPCRCSTVRTQWRETGTTGGLIRTYLFGQSVWHVISPGVISPQDLKVAVIDPLSGFSTLIGKHLSASKMSTVR